MKRRAKSIEIIMAFVLSAVLREMCCAVSIESGKAVGKEPKTNFTLCP